MFEKEIKFISDFSLNKIKKLGSFFTFEKLLNSDIHPAILHYINSEIDYLLYQDRNKLLQKSAFDYSGSEISKHFSLIGTEIKKHKKVSYEDIKKLLMQAVSFNVNFVVKPKWSLTKLVYGDSEVKQVDEVKIALNYIFYYDYIKNIFNEYLAKKKIFTLSQVEFEAILNKIDKAVLTSQSNEILDNALYSIGEFHNIGSMNKTKITLLSFESFLKEKNLIDLLLKLRKSFPAETKQKYDIEDIRSVLYSVETFDAATEDFVEDFEEDSDYQVEDENKNETEIIDNEIFADANDEVKILIDEENEIEFEEPSKENEDEIENENQNEAAGKVDEINYELNQDEKIQTEALEDELDSEILNDVDSNLTESLGDEEIILDDDDDFKIVEDDLIIDGDIEKELNKGLEAFNIEEETGDILSRFDEELKSFEKQEDIDEIKLDSDEDEVKFNIEEKANLNSLYDFEEEDDAEQSIEEVEDEIELEESLDADNTDEKELENYFEIENETENEKTETSNIDEDDFESLEETNKIINDKDKSELYEETDEFVSEEQNEIEENAANQIKQNIERDKDLFSFLSDREIDKIVSGIFNDDREDFANTMEKISECNDYDQSTEILKGLFITYRVNPYSKEAVMLTNAVSNYFDQA